jgi:hypothetical protein
MLAMILATLGWAAWWVTLFAVKVAPASAEFMVVAATVASGVCALPGLLIAALTVRARRTWLLFVLVPLFANGALLLMPWLASGMLEQAP